MRRSLVSLDIRNPGRDYGNNKGSLQYTLASSGYIMSTKCKNWHPSLNTTLESLFEKIDKESRLESFFDFIPSFRIPWYYSQSSIVSTGLRIIPFGLLLHSFLDLLSYSLATLLACSYYS
ncbi:hypothetical protein Pst134EA_013269 [Puccinia striiformis f. sp. tritici]|uniref:hypothetical protein n=1 Tax=Puccinia striiformis f. sp. tritici TaxID=168172 RepID=UPI002007F4B7|nr:hypothetical protein Pst134EA_013269 [Puccinia striiformis f. sp. tritici]KAH9465385.1 hypothetical protein Pst134EA_013269 [Puccinia striiformis f. sp. tritici]